jgi:uncharacterized protein
MPQWRSASLSGLKTGSRTLADTVLNRRSSNVCFGEALVLRAKAEGRNPVYYVLGETAAGRHLFCVVIAFPDGKGYPVTAREMTASEKQRYASWKKS